MACCKIPYFLLQSLVSPTLSPAILGNSYQQRQTSCLELLDFNSIKKSIPINNEKLNNGEIDLIKENLTSD